MSGRSGAASCCQIISAHSSDYKNRVASSARYNAVICVTYSSYQLHLLRRPAHRECTHNSPRWRPSACTETPRRRLIIFILAKKSPHIETVTKMTCSTITASCDCDARTCSTSKETILAWSAKLESLTVPREHCVGGGKSCERKFSSP